MIIAIDGASRRNGKPDCLAAGGIFIKSHLGYSVAASHEKFATNQRGEMLGLIAALTIAVDTCAQTQDPDLYLVTDSEYLFNAISKDWLTNWSIKGWMTAAGSPVKNQDLWYTINELLNRIKDHGVEVVVYHIKGHLLSLGKVTARNSLYADPTGEGLYRTMWDKYEEAQLKKPQMFLDAYDLFERNHLYKAPPEIFKEFVVMNTVADYVATTYIDKIDSEWSR